MTSAIEIAELNGEMLADGIYPTGTYVLKASRVDMQVILEELSELLVDLVPDDDGEPNATGRLIESLIDKFQNET